MGFTSTVPGDHHRGSVRRLLLSLIRIRLDLSCEMQVLSSSGGCVVQRRSLNSVTSMLPSGQEVQKLVFRQAREALSLLSSCHSTISCSGCLSGDHRWGNVENAAFSAEEYN